MMTTYSSALNVRPASTASPRTYSAMKAPPTTVEEASSLLSSAERLLRSGAPNGPLLELSRFLGANSRAWTPANRTRLRRILSGLGAAAIDAVLTTIQERPRTDILDEAELLLRTLPPDSISRLRALLGEQSLLPGVRACLMRAAARAGGLGTPEILHAALNDVEPELRDGAAALIGELGVPQGQSMLERRLARETNEMVKESIREALASVSG